MLKQKLNPFLLSFFCFPIVIETMYDKMFRLQFFRYLFFRLQKQTNHLTLTTVFVLRCVGRIYTSHWDVNIEKELIVNFNLVELIMGLRIINPCFNRRQLNPKRKT